MPGLQELVREVVLVAVREFHRAILPFHANPSSATVPDQEKIVPRAPSHLQTAPYSQGTRWRQRAVKNPSCMPKHGQATLADGQGPDLAASEVRGFWPARDFPTSPMHPSVRRLHRQSRNYAVICSSCYSAQPISHHGMYLLITPSPASMPREKADHDRCVDGCGRVTVLEGGGVVFGPQDTAAAPNDPIRHCHVRRYRPFSRRSAQIQGTHCHQRLQLVEGAYHKDSVVAPGTRSIRGAS
jgi:hypothetical protein